MSNSQAAANNRVLMIVRDDSRDLDLMLAREVFVMRDLIAAAGHAVDIATVTDAPLAGTQVTLTPDLPLEAIRFSDYRGLMLPCMAPVPGDLLPDRIVRLIESALAQGLAVGAMRGSVRELARAGGLSGHRYAYAGEVDLDRQPEFHGASYAGTGVVTDGKIATAGICPLAAQAQGGVDGTTALTEAFLELLTAAPA